MWCDVEYLFMCLSAHLHIFGDMSVQGFYQFGLRFFFLLLSFRSSYKFYILNHYQIYDFKKSFSHFVSYIFIYLIMTFDEQISLLLMKSNLLILSFIACAFSTIYLRILIKSKFMKIYPQVFFLKGLWF